VSMAAETSPPAGPGFPGEEPFPEWLSFEQPGMTDPESLTAELRTLLGARTPTNGSRIKELEARAAEYLGVENCIAVASVSAGLMLLLRAAELTGDLVLPSFTFAATAHAAAWNGLYLIFADVDEETLTLSSRTLGERLGVRTSGILATHTFGAPCDVEALSEVARRAGVRLFFDATHALGARHGDTPIGRFGDGGVFGLMGTGVPAAAEVGIVATNDVAIAERCRAGRDEGEAWDDDCLFVGLNARISELQAAVAQTAFEGLELRVERRNRLAGLYREGLHGLPGISFPSVRPGDRSALVYLPVLVEKEGFGLDATELARALGEEGVETRRYHSPPVHEMRAYRTLARANGHLGVTESAAARILALPLRPDMDEAVVDRLVATVRAIHGRASRS